MRGSITLYLSMTVSLLLSLVSYTIESCHLDAVSCHAEGISYIAVDSLFSHYCLPLFEDYGIFAINAQGLDMESTLQTYVDKNCETPTQLLTLYSSFINLSAQNSSIDKYHYLTDNDGAVFIEQIREYVKYLEIEDGANALLNDLSSVSPNAFSQSESGTPNISFDDLDNSVIEAFIPEDVARTGETTADLNGIDPKDFHTSVSSSIGHIIENGLLSCIVVNPADVSTASIDKTELPSVTCQLSQDGINASYGYFEDIGKATYDKACFCEYIVHTFGNYTDTSGDSPLKYQMEYIISGTPDDDTNLINTSLQLITYRTGFNLLHLLSDSDKFNAAWKLASTASAIPGVPYLIQTIILTVWATAEAVIDVRDLLSNKSVPLIKDDNHWTLSLQGLKNFSKNTLSNNDGETGLSYSRYLEMLMALQNNISIYYRTLDLIQLELCSTYSDDFRLSQCVTGINATIKYTLPSLISPKKYNYTSKASFNYN